MTSAIQKRIEKLKDDLKEKKKQIEIKKKQIETKKDQVNDENLQSLKTAKSVKEVRSFFFFYKCVWNV